MTIKFTVIRDFATVIREFDDVHAAMRCASMLSMMAGDATFAVIAPDGVVAKVSVNESKKTILTYGNGREEVWDYKKK